jgi:putative Ca2+/H+ antiporter (TMEM165/GDT1 family)
MAASADWLQVILGCSIGHLICTLLAVLSAKYISLS